LPQHRKSKKTVIPKGILPSWQKNYVIGIDECICVVKNRTRKLLTASDASEALEIKGAKEWVNKQFAEGNIICFLTTREEKLRSATEKWLSEHGFKYHSLVMNKPVAEQYHYIDDRHVQATTFRGKFAPFVKKEHTIQVFS
jgi:hypothetical protein